jgi:DNA-binding GntR family transcriptional regulator
MAAVHGQDGGSHPVSQADLAYQRLRGLVRDGTHRPGALLSEYTLAQQIGLGRTPLREAVSRLVHEGLLRRLPGRGVLVNTLTAKDVSDLYEVREWLEALCVRRGAHAFGEQEIADLRRMHDDATARVEEGVSWQDYRQLDQKFHMALWAGGRNERAMELLITSYDAVILDPWSQEIADMPGQSLRSITEHREIVEALEARDADASEAAMRRHAQSYRRILATRMFGPLWETDQ